MLRFIHWITRNHKTQAACMLVATAMAALGGCYNPSFRDGLPCSSEGKCPDGQTCAADNLCYAVPPNIDPGPVEPLPRCLQPGIFPSAILESPDPQIGGVENLPDRFGAALAMNDELLVVGVPEHDDAAVDAGALYVFTRADGIPWSLSQHFAPLGIAPGTRLTDREIAISGTTIFASAQYDSTFGPASGAVYIFDIAQSEEPVQVLFSEPAAGVTPRYFGDRLAVDGDRAAVAAYTESAVYVYERSGGVWQLMERVYVAGFAGGAVAIRGDLLAVGSVYDSEAGLEAGAVLLYRWNGATWAPEAKLLGKDLAPLDDGWLGESVLIWNNLVIAGAPLDDRLGQDAGAVHVFHNGPSGWAELQRLEPPFGQDIQYFGHRVAIAGGALAVSAPEFRNTGAVEIYSSDGLSFTHAFTLECPEAGLGSWCGDALASTNTELVVSAPQAGPQGLGQVYAHSVSCL